MNKIAAIYLIGAGLVLSVPAYSKAGESYEVAMFEGLSEITDKFDELKGMMEDNPFSGLGGQESEGEDLDFEDDFDVDQDFSEDDLDIEAESFDDDLGLEEDLGEELAEGELDPFSGLQEQLDKLQELQGQLDEIQEQLDVLQKLQDKLDELQGYADKMKEGLDSLKELQGFGFGGE